MKRSQRRFSFYIIAGLLLFHLICPAPGHGGNLPEVMFILDASGSMWGQINGTAKIEIAQTVLGKIVSDLPGEVKTGLTAYGHNRKGDCSDIEILIPPGSDQRQALLSAIEAITPKGKTPIAGAVEKVAAALKENESETTVILLSDGEETCNPDPCDTVRKIKDSSIRFVLYVVGFDVTEAQKEELSCIAEAGGGSYYSAENADSLLAAFESVKETVSEKVEKAKATRKKAATRLGKINISMPAAATVSLNKMQIIRKKDNKTVKEIEDPAAQSMHPLLSGNYEIAAGFANSNYKPDSDVSFGVYTVKGGETTSIELGAMAFNIAESLRDIPAGAVIIKRTNGSEFTLELPYTGNSYYFYKAKPLPPGRYDFAVHYKKRYTYYTDPTPVVLSSGVDIEAGQVRTVTLETGFRLKEAPDAGLKAWRLVPAEEGEGSAGLHIKTASNGDYPLWETYAVLPGTYHLEGYIKGMKEPLPLGEGISISAGDLVTFDAGL
jgi:Mg-chelatase subunit ChlD